MKLNLPRRTKKRLPTRERQSMDVIPLPNQVWSMDFMSDALYRGRRFRTLNVLDEGVTTYNEYRPYDALERIPPAMYVRNLKLENSSLEL